jgi:hypothetical protein
LPLCPSYAWPSGPTALLNQQGDPKISDETELAKLGDSFIIKDEGDREVLHVQGAVFTWGNQLSIREPSGKWPRSSRS